MTISQYAQNNFRWWYFFVGYVCFMIGMIVSSMLMNYASAESLNTVGPVLNILQFVIGGITCLVILRLLTKKRLTRTEFGIHLNGLYRVIGIGAVLGLLFWGLSYIAENYSEELRKGGEEVAQSFKLNKNLTSDLLLLLNIGLFAPVIEEILFRGTVFQSLFKGLKKYPKIPEWVALLIGVIVSSFLFISVHGGGGQDAQMGFLALLGVFTALAFYITKSLFAGVFVHAVNNNIVFITYVCTLVGLDNSYGVMLVVMSVICLILCVPLTLLLGKILPQNIQ